MMKKVVEAALLYPEWLEKTGRKAAFDELHPDKDADEYAEYGADHKF